MGNHVGTVRKDQASASIRKKIVLLRQYVANEIPEGGFFPKNMTQFRGWEDKQLEITRIGSPNTMDRPHNKLLKEEAAQLIRQLLTKTSRRKRKTLEIGALHSQRLDDKRLIQDLTNQLQSSEQKRLQAEIQVARISKRLVEANSEIGTLTKQLRAIVPLRSK
jgi:hypothetical protein